jgi:citrate lyase subunit beta/citryl-CoA lyase
VRVAEAVGRRPLHLLVESARGVEAALELARAHVQVSTIGLGEADLRADLGVTDDGGLLFARSRVVVAAAAAGLGPPSMSVFTDVRDLEALRQSCIEGRRLGLVGRAAIHPAQLSVIEDVFAPTAAEIARALEVVEAASAGAASGIGAVALADGRFVDEAVVRQARRLLDRAGLSS